MPLSAGDKLGAYEIVSLLGKGGMGEVWRARDPQIGRDVAIKASAQQFTDRFEREVRAIGALNHSNICTLYHVGPNYLVMELVDGPTLAERIKEGPIQLDEALGYAKQIADALEAAHEKSIVHRDLKPANIKIRPDGSVKVLDFGLAKAGEAQEVTADSPTMMPGTQIGMILGTAGYMSPEQARGKNVDKRADIWAFGVVLYEMLAGKRLFEGETVSDTLAAVLRAEPDLTLAPEKTRRLLRACLEKDPKRRLRDIGDMGRLLEEASGTASPTQAASLPHMTWIAAAVMTVAFGIALWAPWRAQKPVNRPLVQLDVDLGPEVSLRTPAGGPGSGVIISSDGTRLLYFASVSGGTARLFTRRLDQPKATELSGTEGAAQAFFSPDGQWVGFCAKGVLNKISSEGGPVVRLADLADTAFGGSWGSDGNIIVAQQRNGWVRVPSAGGAPMPVAEMANGKLSWFPQILPGENAWLFMGAGGNERQSTVEVVSLKDHHRKILARGDVPTPRYLGTSGADGYLLYADNRSLFAVPFDRDRLETLGAAVPVVNEVAVSTGQGNFGQFDVSNNGTLVYRKGGSAFGMTTVQWLDGAGKKEPLLAKPGVYGMPRLSPDGRRLALSVGDGANNHVWVYDEKRDLMTPLSGSRSSYSPVWSPDGRYVVFSTSGGMFWTRADGAGQPQPLTQSTNQQIPASFTPDGKRLAYLDGTGPASQIWTLPIEDEGGQLKAGKAEQFLKSLSADRGAAFSPEGRWLAYYSNESGKPEVYVRPFPAPASGHDTREQISNNGGQSPVWSSNGRELLYVLGDQVMAVSYTAKGDSFVAEKPRVWAAKLGTVLASLSPFDSSPDGKRLAVLTPAETPEAPNHEVTILFNFLDELRRRVPAAK